MQPPAQAVAQAQELARLATLATVCEHSAPYHAYRGLLLLLLNQLDPALEALEKALLLNPNLPGTQLDYVQALALAGQKPAARELLHNLLQRPDFPVNLRPQLVQANGSAATAWRWSAMVQASTGYETNLANATHTQDITLTLPIGPVNIHLADTEHPRPGSAQKLQTAAWLARSLAWDTELQLHATAMQRSTGISNPADPRQLEAAAAWVIPTRAGTLTATLNQQHIAIDQQTAYTSALLSVKYETPRAWNPCQWSPELGNARPRYPQTPTLNGSYRFARLSVTCSGNQQQTLATLASGTDTPLDPTRPGGTRTRQELQLSHDRLWATTQLSLWIRWARTHDASAYSTLLSNLPSQTHITSLGLGLWWPINDTLHIGADLESTSQNSNNPLDNIRNTTVYAGLRWYWH